MTNDRLHTFADAAGPFVSLYIDDTRDSPSAEKQAAARWRAIRRHLEDSGVTEHVAGAVERAVLHSEPGVGRAGRAVIAGREGVLLNEHLSVPPSITVLRVSQYPYLLPLLELPPWRPTYVFAAVDHLGAELTEHRNGVVHRETVQGPGQPVHKPVTAGWQGYGDLQHSTDEAVRMNARAVADRITELVDRDAVHLLFLCGEVDARSAVQSFLPQRVSELVVSFAAGSRGGRVSEREAADRIDEEFAGRRRKETDATLARLTGETARRSGLAVQGLADVCAALRNGAVDTLIVGEVGSATVVCGQDRTTIAPDADALSELGEAPNGIALADEAVPFVALSTGSALIRADDAASLTDGVAALLRYPLHDLPGRPAPVSGSRGEQR